MKILFTITINASIIHHRYQTFYKIGLNVHLLLKVNSSNYKQTFCSGVKAT